MIAAAVSSLAWANPPTVQVAVCADLKPQYDDASSAVGDDFVNTSPATVDAYGMWLEVRLAGSAVWSGYLTSSGGCMANTIALSPSLVYEIKLVSKASINGNTLLYQDNGGTGSATYATTWSNASFPTAGTYTFQTGNTQMARVMAAMVFALKNRDLGLTGKTIEVFRKETTTEIPCPGKSCAGNLLVDTVNGNDDSKKKQTIVHELGHQLQFLKAAEQGAVSVPFDYTKSAEGNCGGGNGHAQTTVEWHSAAAIEGFAQFYNAAVWNDPSGSGCGNASAVSLDWDGGGLDGSFYNCDGEPVGGLGLSTADYLQDECMVQSGQFLTITQGSANQYDYERFFWDLFDKEGLTGSDIAAVIGKANNPDGNATTDDAWNATDGSLLGNGGADPNVRMNDAADALGFQPEWEDQAILNGVTR